MNATKAAGEGSSVDANGDFNQAVSQKYVENPTISYGTVSDTFPLGTAIGIKKSAFTKGADNKYTLTITITFAWGTAFTDGTHANPYDYFKNLGYSDVNAKKLWNLTLCKRKLTELATK